MTRHEASGLETKFARFDEEIEVTGGTRIAGYASLFGLRDQGGDTVAPGAYGKSLDALKAADRQVKMLWQHDPGQPIGVWDEVRENAKGLFVRGRILTDIPRGRDAAALIEAGAIDGLSIGYRTKAATKDEKGRRLLTELELWEVSLVTFPMLPDARIGTKAEADGDAILRDLAETIQSAREILARDAREPF